MDAEAGNSKAVTSANGVKSYPTIKFFPAGSTEAEAYSGGRSEDDLIKFINEKAGTHRVAGGGLDFVAGTLEAFNTVVAQLTDTTKLSELAQEVQKQTAELTDASQKKYAEYYVRVFDKLSQSDNYVAKELARLDGILTKGGLAPSKRDEIKAKSNVLRKFAEALGDKIQSIRDEL